MNKLIKKIIILALSMLFIVLNFSYTQLVNTVEAVESPFSKETIEWLEWFNSLPYEEQQAINYVPCELVDYLDGKSSCSNEQLELADFNSSLISPNQNLPNDPGAGGMSVGGYEFSYNPSYWNGTRINKANCYYYAMNVVSSSTNKNHQQPGYKAGVSFALTQSSIINAVKKDVPYFSNVVSVRASSYSEIAGVNEYKVALVIAPNKDYHWYRQNSDCTWSHKRGHTEVVKTDASGYVVRDPQMCDRNYGSINYSTFAGYYIVKYQ